MEAQQIELDIADATAVRRLYPEDAQNGESFVVQVPSGWVVTVFMDGQYINVDTAEPVKGEIRKWARLPD